MQKPALLWHSLFVLGGLCLIAPGAVAIDWDHVHLVAPDTKAATAWYHEQFGGTVTKSGPFDAILFGTNLVKFKKGGEDTGASGGSPVDHIGFSVADVDAKLKVLEAAGAKIVSQARYVEAGGFSFAFVEDPWGTKIELIDDKDTPGFHHVHLMTADPEKTIQWYADVYGGEITRFKNLPPLPAILYGDMWLLASKVRGELSGFKGRSIDHLGWLLDDFEGTVATLKEKGAAFLVGPQKSGDHMMAFIEGPDGVKIELVEEVKH